MNKKQKISSEDEDDFEYPVLRFPHPKVIEKLKKTQNLIKEGVNSKDFKNKGGLSLEDYKSFLTIIERRHKTLKQYIKRNKADNYTKLRSSKRLEIKDPVIGTKNALVLLVDFKDRIGETTPIKFQDLLFSTGQTESGSVRDYFNEVSWNQLDLNGDVSDWYRADMSYSEYKDLSYVNKDTVKWKMPKARKLVREVLLKAKKSGKFADFSKYDNDGDGKVDMLIVVYAGKGAERTSDFSNIYPHQGKLTEPLLLQEDLVAEKYVLIHELPFYDLGGFCHEISHLLGVPDLYYPDLACTVVGKWCLMGLGCFNDSGRTPGHLSAWCKIHLGWVEPEIIGGKPQNFEIPVVTDPSKKIYKLEIQGTNGKEYFLVENRQQKGFDKFLPGGGLLIWHVDESRAMGHSPNFETDHLFVSLEQADGRRELETKVFQFGKGQVHITMDDYLGDYGDIYPGETHNLMFNQSSDPPSDSYRRMNSCVSITSISEPGDIMEAKMGLVCDKPSPITDKQLEYEKPFFIPFKVETDEFQEEIKEKKGLNIYQEGYTKGYQRGFHAALKKLKK